MMRRLIVIAFCATLVGCTAARSGTPTKRSAPESATFEEVPWRWADYSNRVWINVSGVGVEVPSTGGVRVRKVGDEVTSTNAPSLKQVRFMYSPNTGKSPAEAIAISSFNMFSGYRAELLLLKVLFGMEGTSLSHSNVVSDRKAFHIYSFKTDEGKTNTVYFDASMYHHLF